MAERRYFWLKLKEDFFESKRIKKLRRMAGGDTLTIIYLKMQLKSIKTDGVLTYTGLESSFAEELALDLDESPDDVLLLLNYLSATGLIETSDNINFFLPYALQSIGSESASAERVRNYREKQKSLQCNADVTEMKRIGNGEIEKEIEKEIDKDNGAKRTKFTPPTLDEVRAYCKERNNQVDPERFIDYYASQNWKKANGQKVQNWQACIRQWEKDRPAVNGTNETFKNALRRTKK